MFLLASIACSNAALRDPCNPIDPVLANSSFVAVIEPTAGLRASSPLQVRGCSRTFESNVVWELRSRDGRILATGHTSGGGVTEAAPFSLSVTFTVFTPELG
ncbi:MAG TPA: Gmad2 immunoglobulin-like domain-containing protein, partial [Gemmatimonadales bacterium]|nr:Gmad2 immunoglobulin-like domain-containing protein [Gemmatimonadales bacterium]